MRVLLASSMGGAGHLTPIVRVGEALRRAGHEVRLLVPPSLAAMASETGIASIVGEQPPAGFVEEVWDRMRSGGADAAYVDRELFARRCTPAMLPAARAARDIWRPDLVVREPCEYASAVVAHESAIPLVQVAISLAAIEWGVLWTVSAVLEETASGVSDTISSAPYLTSFPASVDPSPWTDTRRFHVPVASGSPLPDWWPGDRRPLVSITFGSVVGHLQESDGVFRTVLEVASQVEARVLLTVGHAVPVETLGPVPGNVHVEQWVPQDEALAHVDLVLCHGGSGTTYGALGAGVPLVICPLFADQHQNADVVEALGAGVTVDRSGATSGRVRSLGHADVEPIVTAIEQVLGDPRYRVGARRAAAEITATPTIDEVVRTQW
jgi:UDP:flavonoid glycosyltransferase YjiC (YdhE family)